VLDATCWKLIDPGLDEEVNSVPVVPIDPRKRYRKPIKCVYLQLYSYSNNKSLMMFGQNFPINFNLTTALR